jgi:hypothetical protein
MTWKLDASGIGIMLLSAVFPSPTLVRELAKVGEGGEP